jgi:ribose 5-phosphate isomerase B
MRISIGCDHAGFQLKEKIIDFILSLNHDVLDCGTLTEERCDYPDYAHLVAKDVSDSFSDMGVLICGSGNGVSMTANKWQGVRCALCWNDEIAKLAREHNDANILSIPSRFMSEEDIFTMLSTFLNTEFEGGRHTNRVYKINPKG